MVEERLAGAAVRSPPEPPYRAVLDQYPAGVALLTPDHTVLWVNRTLCGLLGYLEKELIGTRLGDLVHPDDRAAPITAPDTAAAEPGNPDHAERRCIRGDGKVIWTELRFGLLRAPLGATDMIIVQIHDVSVRVSERQRMQWLAGHDPLTSAVNRAGLSAALSLLEPGADGGRSAALMYLDLDGFKQINDTHGHVAGDRYLVRVAELLHSAVRATDIVCRTGGDEFIVVALDVRSPADARRIAGTILSSVDGMAAEFADLPKASISIGIALTPATSTAELMVRADRALYRAKNAGGNRVEGP